MATKEHPNGYYNHDKVLEIASTCKDYTEFHQRYPAARQAASKNGWIPEIKAILPHKTYWTREMCEQEIKDKGYKTKKEFREGNPGAYSHATKHGFLDDICKGMEAIGRNNRRRIYVYEFEDGYAYVGLSGDMKNRNSYHLNHIGSPVCRHIKETESKHELKIISDWMSKEDAQVYEDEMIKIYAAAGWNVLNTKKGGSLGGAKIPKYNIDELKAAASTCNYRTEFKRKYPSMYEFIFRYDIVEEVIGWMPKFYMPPLYWTDDRLHDAVKDTGYLKQALRDKYPGAYEAILRQDRMEDFFGKEKRKVKHRTPDEAIVESRQYKSLSELMRNNQGLYTYIIRHNLQDECFKGLEKMEMHANYTWEDIDAAITASRNLTQMRKEHTYEYRAALRNPEWRRELFKRLPSRKHKSNL